MKKVLIITYYWPPSGGAGVQRWMKLSKYLSKQNIEVHILTVDEEYASYPQLDYSLEKEIDNYRNIFIHKTKSFEIIDYYSRIVGKKNIPTAGFSNVNNKSIFQRFAVLVRSNIFIPDPRRGWNRYAYKEALKIVKDNGIKTVITSSPPHSTQLIGLKLKKKLGINWIADLRDPWTDIYYYQLLNHTLLSKAIDKYYEKKILAKADKIFTVSGGLKELFVAKSKEINTSKIIILPNGFDPEDFDRSPKLKNENKFVICYTGTMSEQYKPQVFLEAFAEFVLKKRDSKIILRFVGNVSKSIIDTIRYLKMEKYFEYVTTVPHDVVISYQKNAFLLLLVIPDVKNSKGILTGKLFEYLASGNRILSIGDKNGDAAIIIDECEAGKTFERNQKNEILQYLSDSYNYYKKGNKDKITNTNILKYNRQEQAKNIVEVLNDSLK